MTAQWYFRRIRRLLSEIPSATKLVHRANRYQVHQFVSSQPVCLVENILSGLRNVSEWDYVDWDSDPTFLKFRDYVLGIESKMDQLLCSWNYLVGPNMLSVVLEEGRVEKVTIVICSMHLLC